MKCESPDNVILLKHLGVLQKAHENSGSSWGTRAIDESSR